MSRRAIRYWTARAAVNRLAIVAAEIAVTVVAGLAAAWWTAVALTVLAGTAHALIMPRWRYRVHRWEVTDQALYRRIWLVLDPLADRADQPDPDH